MLRTLWNRWLPLAHQIGTFQSRILLTLFYFFIVTPFGLAVRLGMDPLQRKTRPSASGWNSREDRRDDLAGARRQF